MATLSNDELSELTVYTINLSLRPAQATDDGSHKDFVTYDLTIMKDSTELIHDSRDADREPLSMWPWVIANDLSLDATSILPTESREFYMVITAIDTDSGSGNKWRVEFWVDVDVVAGGIYSGTFMALRFNVTYNQLKAFGHALASELDAIEASYAVM